MADRFLSYISKKGKILDVGCGPGQYTIYFGKNGADCIGIDISSETLLGAKRRYIDGMYCQMSMAKIGFPDAIFDALWVCSSIVHIPEEKVPHILSELGRVLRRGGFMFVNVQLGIASRIESPEEFDRGGATGRFFQRYSSRFEFERHLDIAGFETISSWENSILSSVLEKAGDNQPRWLNIISTKR